MILPFLLPRPTLWIGIVGSDWTPLSVAPIPSPFAVCLLYHFHGLLWCHRRLSNVFVWTFSAQAKNFNVYYKTNADETLTATVDGLPAQTVTHGNLGFCLSFQQLRAWFLKHAFTIILLRSCLKTWSKCYMIAVRYIKLVNLFFFQFKFLSFKFIFKEYIQLHFYARVILLN